MAIVLACEAVLGRPRLVRDLTPLRSWGTFGQGEGQFITPVGLAIGNDGVCVSDIERDDIQVFSLDGEYRLTISEHGPGVGQRSGPGYVSVAPDGTVWIDGFSYRISAFAPVGKVRSVWGESGTAPGQFNNPVEVAVDP